MTEQTTTGGFVEEIEGLSLTHCNTNPLWAKTIAIGTLSPFIQKIWYETWRGKVSPHIFGLCIGPSGLAEKSLPLETIIRPILRNIDKMLGDKNEDDEDEKYVPTASFIVPYNPNSSMQALTTWASKNKRGLLAVDEFSSILKVAKKDGYLGEILEYLSRLYDGDVGKNATQIRGEEAGDKLCISFLTTTTPYIYEIMRAGFFVQGTGNRFCIVNWDASNINEIRVPEAEKYIPDLAGFDVTREEKCQQIADSLFKFHSFLESRETVTTQMNQKAKKLLRDKIYKMKNEALQKFKGYKLGLDYSYLDRLEIQINKIVLNLTGSKLYGQFIRAELRNEEHLVVAIDEEIVNEACDLVDLYYKNFEAMVLDWETTTVRRQTVVYSTKNLSDLCIQYCKDNRNEEGWVNRRQMLKDLNITVQDFAKIQTTYFEQENQRKSGGKASWWVKLLE